MQAYHIHAQTGRFTGSRWFSTFQFLYVLQSIISEKPNGCKGGYNVCYKINYSSDQGRIYPCSDREYDALFYILYTSSLKNAVTSKNTIFLLSLLKLMVAPVAYKKL